MKVNNREARRLVQAARPFTANNIFAVNVFHAEVPHYIVYSYGTHWPLFIYVAGKWYENSDRHSVTTSKHRSLCHPHMETTQLGLYKMLDIARRGISAVAASEMTA